MKKRICVLCLVLACLLVLTACGCKHETWNAADCLNPKTCAECGETEGEALGHAWVDADCLTPKTCSTCGETEGERIITDARFTTAEALPYFGTWKGDVVISGALLGDMLGYADVKGELPVTVSYTFGNDGTIDIQTTFSDWDAVMSFMYDFIMDMMYSELAAVGLDKDAADAAMEQAYGMSMEEFVNVALAAMKPEDMNSTAQMVYYVEDGVLYGGGSWDEEMKNEEATLDGDTLTMYLEGFGEIVLTRVEE